MHRHAQDAPPRAISALFPKVGAILAVGVTGLAALGCGVWGDSDPTQRSNATACTAYVAELNRSLIGCGLLYDPGNMCSSANYPSVDMAPYYACLVERTRCEGGDLILDVEGCQPPLLRLAGGSAPAAPEPNGAALRSAEEAHR